ncbi:2-oxoacid:acceptor oxidoreductase family protein [Candidatus Woesearchaeota archaeon]|nr:2-oxoacid:acceptor oxidoreductase family protein [Candidatus Woesearchaeota archaeon]
MIELTIIGRGGQGAKTAAQLLAEAAMETGKYVQSFPEYGPERAGAPVKAFTRIDDSLVRVHCAVNNPDIVGVTDPTLLKAVNVTEGLKQSGILVVNTEDSPEAIKKKLNFNGKVFTLDATRISIDTVGKNLPNMPILGAILKATDIVPLDILREMVRHKFEKKIGKDLTDKNILAIEEGHKEVKNA